MAGSYHDLATCRQRGDEWILIQNDNSRAGESLFLLHLLINMKQQWKWIKIVEEINKTYRQFQNENIDASYTRISVLAFINLIFYNIF